MKTAIDIANFFIYLFQDDEDGLTNLKLNKLLYYAQGHAMIRLERPLFAEEIQAWPHGPVVKCVYKEFKKNKNTRICEYTGRFDVTDFTDEECELLVDVAREYGKYTGSTLRNMTHKPGSPWEQYYREEAHDTVIPDFAIKAYFETQEKLLEPFNAEFCEEDFVGYRDSDGCYVLPKGYGE